MDELSILAPVLNRPELAAPLVESVAAASRTDWELVFVLSPGDKAEQRAVKALRHDRVRWIQMRGPRGPGDYQKKINRGFTNSSAGWVFQGSDDLAFHDGWDELAIRTGEAAGVGVVGTNDLCNQLVIRGRHSTHSLVRRSYIEECGGSDTPGKVLHDGYVHNYCDNELVEVAMSRGCFAMSPAIVEHLHPLCGKAQIDGTYQIGMDTIRADNRLFRARREYWGATGRTGLGQVARRR